jgi:hypothetical protein
MNGLWLTAVLGAVGVWQAVEGSLTHAYLFAVLAALSLALIFGILAYRALGQRDAALEKNAAMPKKLVVEHKFPDAQHLPQATRELIERTVVEEENKLDEEFG